MVEGRQLIRIRGAERLVEPAQLLVLDALRVEEKVAVDFLSQGGPTDSVQEGGLPGTAGILAGRLT